MPGQTQTGKQFAWGLEWMCGSHVTTLPFASNACQRTGASAADAERRLTRSPAQTPQLPFCSLAWSAAANGSKHRGPNQVTASQKFSRKECFMVRQVTIR
eukprot:6194432-Pleurochrysis_carterae.AAC.4